MNTSTIGGFFRLEGDDFDGVFQRNLPAGSLPFLPYTEFAKLPEIRPVRHIFVQPQRRS